MNWIGVDYGWFYKDGKNIISYKYNILIANRDEDMCYVLNRDKKGLDDNALHEIHIGSRVQHSEENMKLIRINMKIWRY